MSALKSVKGNEGKDLVRVLTGEEELEGLTTPKVGSVYRLLISGADQQGILITGPPGTYPWQKRIKTRADR